MNTNSTRKGLAPFPEKGKPPTTRVKDVNTLHAIFTQFAEDDEASAYNRRLVRDVADGAPPYEDDDIEQDGRFNLNFHDLRALQARETARYTDLIDSVDRLAQFHIPKSLTDDGLNDSREVKQDIIAEEHAKLIRGWSEFYPNWSVLTGEIAQFAVAAGFFPNEKTWKWEPAGLDDFLVPRKAKASEDAIPIMFVRQSMRVDEVYSATKDEKYAKGAGWVIDECRRQMVCATEHGDTKKTAKWERYWADLQEDLAANDLGASFQAEVVPVIHAFVREFDGSISHFMFSEENPKDFMFKRLSRYKAANEAYTLFVMNTGRGGKIHSARGLLYLAYPYVQAMNRLRCSGLDATAYSMALFLQSPEAESMEDMAVVLNGPVGWLPPEANVVESRVFPNLAQNALPMLADLDASLNSNLGMEQYDTGAPSTKYGQKVQQVIEGTLSGTNISVFYRSWKKLLWEQFQRIRRIGPGDDKYPEVRDFYKALELRGVTEEDVNAVTHLEPFRSAGAGSASMRLLAFDEAMQTIGMLDEVGRHFLLRDRFAARFGPDLADRYVGSKEQPRFVLDRKFAELENTALRTDPNVVPMAGENHAVHAQVHLAAAITTVQELVQALSESGQEANPAAFQPGIAFVEALVRHTGPHLQEVAMDETRKELFGELRKAFQQVEAQWTKVVSIVQSLTPTEEQQNEFMTKLQMQMEKHRLDMQIATEQAQLAAQLKVQEVQQRMNLRRVQTGVKLSQGADIHAFKVATKK